MNRWEQPPTATDTSTDSDPRTWMASAACLGMRDFTEWALEEQIPLCHRCPVRAQCLEYALEHLPGDAYSCTYAGLTGKQLRKIKRGRR